MAEKSFKCPWSTSNSCIVPAFSAWRLRTSASHSSREARLTRSTVGEAAQPTEAAPPPTMPKATSMEAAWDAGRRRRRSGDATIAKGSCFSAVSVGMPPFVPTSGESCEARAQSTGSTWVLASGTAARSAFATAGAMQASTAMSAAAAAVSTAPTATSLDEVWGTGRRRRRDGDATIAMRSSGGWTSLGGLHVTSSACPSRAK
mmetsp:Transcript_93040/g.236670  ORF Transcript_93040/g.236670 Transcript_93040/m.236670 type:complete len:203 (-) Transcript_93040:1276-1884(-)